VEIGLNLSFAVKRWLKPAGLAEICKNELGVSKVQFTWDMIDPWWPEAERNELAKEYRKEFSSRGIEISSSFGGVAAYSYSQLLSPTQLQREISFEFFKRAIDLTRALGSNVMGTPVGGMSYEDSNNSEKRKELYYIALDYLRRLAAYGKEKGLSEILIEATPLITEFPHSPEESLKMMRELDGTTDIPIRLLIDWGHALFKPLLKKKADMELWLKTCSPYVSCIHLQQTDGLWDRHWDFTKEGIVTGELIKKTLKNAKAENIPQFLEVVTIFEDNDDEVLDRMKRSMKILHEMLD
jgi:sugar phosphate isomerase/epimerase